MITIYAMINKDDQCYVGSTKDLYERKRTHFGNQSRGTSSVIKGYKRKEITFITLEIVDLKDRFSRENYWIEFMKNSYEVTNRCLASQGPKGHKRTPEQKKQASDHFKNLWKNNREKMLKIVNQHKTKESQSRAGKIGAFVRHGGKQCQE